MLPLRDHNPSGRFPFVTWLLIAANVVIFGWMFLISPSELETVIERYALVPADILGGRHLETLLTSIFLHGGFTHILGNMLFLHIFGDNVEDRFGHFRFLLFYLVAGLVGSALQIAIDPTSTIPQIGASGAIAGVMGAYLVLYPRHRIDVWWWYGTVTVPATFMLGYWILFQFLYGFGSIGALGGVAYFAHIGGFVFGYLITKIAPHVSQFRQLPS